MIEEKLRDLSNSYLWMYFEFVICRCWQSESQCFVQFVQLTVQPCYVWIAKRGMRATFRMSLPIPFVEFRRLSKLFWRAGDVALQDHA
ncbi:hypothetical protein [Mesorhizobium mediterraneum]|uniref:hypothetical protein n=1 Tax=Mesorhizobium mediterraneum TaxID=43617 RepID=UPI0017870918|nr:hypothetical protein [Mesorhizobium mediterraneum]